MITVESPDLKRLAAGAAVYPKALRAGIRKQLNAGALDAAKASRSKIRGMGVKGDVPYKEAAGLRAAIGSAIKATTTINSLGASSKIYVANTGALTANNRYRVAQLFDKGAPFRHPLFGTWVDGLPSQNAYPYFQTVIAERAVAIRELMQATLLEAAVATLPNVT